MCENCTCPSEDNKHIHVSKIMEENQKLKAENKKLKQENSRLQYVNEIYCKFIGGEQ